MQAALRSKFVALAIILMPAPLLPRAFPQQKQSFDVASIKPHPSRFDVRTTTTIRGGRLVATNYSLKRLVKLAYGRPNVELLDDQIVGGPSWIDTDYFDVAAQVDLKEKSPSYEETLIRLQSLLADRFQLRVHREQRQLPVYELLVDRPGKLKLSSDQTPLDIDDSTGRAKVGTRGVVAVTGSSSGMLIGGDGVRIASLADLLQTILRRRVVDKTDLKGLFDIRAPLMSRIDVTPPASAAELSPAAPDPIVAGSPFAVSLENLGLRLKLTNALVEVLVIESVQRPSAN